MKRWWRHQMEPSSALLALCEGIHGSPVNSSHKGQWRRGLMFTLMCAWTNGWANNGDASDLRFHRAHYDVTVIEAAIVSSWPILPRYIYSGITLVLRRLKSPTTRSFVQEFSLADNKQNIKIWHYWSALWEYTRRRLPVMRKAFAMAWRRHGNCSPAAYQLVEQITAAAVPGRESFQVNLLKKVKDGLQLIPYH